MRLGLYFVALLLVSCGSDDTPVGDKISPATEGPGQQPVTVEAVDIQAKYGAELVTKIRPGGGLIVQGSSTELSVVSSDTTLSFPIDLTTAAEVKINSPKINQCTVALLMKLESPTALNFEVHTQWKDDVQKIDCWVFEAEMRRDGLAAELSQVKFGERDLIKSVTVKVLP